MGARGLLNYLRTHRDARSRSFSLASRADDIKGGGKAVIVCDFISVIMWLLGWFHEGMVKGRFFSLYSYIYGADFEEYTKRILGFVEALEHIKVHPVFFVDGPRGSTRSDMEAKLQTWLTRQSAKESACSQVVKFCEYDPKHTTLSHRSGLRILFLHHIVQVLQKTGAEVVICNGEADRFMAEYARKNPNTCGILTTDTDLTMMAGCTTLHCKFFDREDTLKLKLPVINVKPDDIRCEMIEPDRLARSLGIHVNCLPALSILCGNDYTAYYTEQEPFRSELNMTCPYVEWAAQWISNHKNRCKTAMQFLSIPEIRRICDIYPDYRSAVVHSYHFYEEDSVRPDSVPTLSDVHGLTPEILDGKMNAQFLSIINSSVYWHNPVEQPLEGKRSDDVYAKLLSVRKCMYSLLCLESVTEYGHTRAGPKIVRVNPCAEGLLRKLRTSLSVEQKMLTVCVILVSQDQISPTSKSLKQACDKIISDHTGLEDHFNALSLLAYASIAQAYKLSVITEEYLDPLILTCLCSSVGEQSRKMVLRPTSEAIVCASHFACIVEHAYNFASLLGLYRDLPLPSEVFKASTYVPFHMMALKSGKCHGEDENLQAFYKELSASVPEMEKLKSLVKCSDETSIIAFDETFQSSQAHLKEFLSHFEQLPIRKGKSAKRSASGASRT